MAFWYHRLTVTLAQQKARTRARIITAASRIARARGFGGAAVDRVMATAGLTHGGFYAHFRDKWALMEEALHAAFDESETNLLGDLDGAMGDAVLRAGADRYLTVAHAEHPHAGCAIPALGGEVARAPEGPRAVFRERVERLVQKQAELVGGDAEAARQRVIVTLALSAGALLLARAVGEPRLRDEILSAARAHLGLPPVKR
jgi:TetR/AcrR family transcriptional repressor of nem operon